MEALPDTYFGQLAKYHLKKATEFLQFELEEIELEETEREAKNIESKLVELYTQKALEKVRQGNFSSSRLPNKEQVEKVLNLRTRTPQNDQQRLIQNWRSHNYYRKSKGQEQISFENYKTIKNISNASETSNFLGKFISFFKK